jgi:putative serine protease PepD
MSDQYDPDAETRRVPREGGQGPEFWSSHHPTPAEHTTPLPPYQQPAPATASAPARRSGALTAAALVGALVLGGAAGVGGAAWYDAWQGDGSSSSTTTASDTGPVQQNASTTTSVASGSVEKVAAVVLPSVVKINVTGQSESGSGSGIVLNKGGDILTNNHVVAVAGKTGTITVNFNDGSTRRATVVGTDPVTDIAVIHVAGAADLTPATIGKSSALQVGQEVVAVGSPYGLNATVTSGIVSALNRPVSVATSGQPPQQSPFGIDPFGTDPFGQQQQQQQAQPQDLSTTYPAIQTDAAINPGNSGGPLVDMSGRVVGINSSIRTDGSTESGSIGLGFAIPIDEVLPIINQLENHQTPTHARLGVTVADLTGSQLQQGAVIKGVDNSAAAAAAGLKDGDVITRVDDQVIDGSESLVATVRGHRPGDKVQLTYSRSGQTHTTTATLGSDANTRTS